MYVAYVLRRIVNYRLERILKLYVVANTRYSTILLMSGERIKLKPYS
jgi:hypothetical protein